MEEVIGSLDLLNGLVLLSVILFGSAFWQANARIQEENQFFLPLIEPIYSWRTDSLLWTYLILLVLLIILTVFIANTSVADYTFWWGFGLVVALQQTAMGQRIGRTLVEWLESPFKPAHRDVHSEKPIHTVR